ncbi:MAG: type II toxin-antitoxin system VapC family toxin [Acidobacteriota bacterium]
MDASALVEYLLRTPAGTPIDSLMTGSDSVLHIPALCDVEVCSALRRALLQERISERRTAEALQDYMDLPLTRHDHQPLMAGILELRSNFSAYDATYIALAGRLKASFATTDRRLARAARQRFPDWQVVP